MHTGALNTGDSTEMGTGKTSKRNDYIKVQKMTHSLFPLFDNVNTGFFCLTQNDGREEKRNDRGQH